MLSDAIRSLKAGPKPTKHADGGGLFILVNPDGKKHWRLSYRFAGKQKLLSGGPYPIVKLSEARKSRDEAKAHYRATDCGGGAVDRRATPSVRAQRCGSNR